MEEYFLHSLPHVDMKILEINNKARKPNMGFIRGTPSMDYVLRPVFLLSLSSVAQGVEQEGKVSEKPGVV